MVSEIHSNESNSFFQYPKILAFIAKLIFGQEQYPMRLFESSGSFKRPVCENTIEIIERNPIVLITNVIFFDDNKGGEKWPS